MSAIVVNPTSRFDEIRLPTLITGRFNEDSFVAAPADMDQYGFQCRGSRKVNYQFFEVQVYIRICRNHEFSPTLRRNLVSLILRARV